MHLEKLGFRGKANLEKLGIDRECNQRKLEIDFEVCRLIRRKA
jgi:hypothetical protein